MEALPCAFSGVAQKRRPIWLDIMPWPIAPPSKKEKVQEHERIPLPGTRQTAHEPRPVWESPPQDGGGLEVLPQLLLANNRGAGAPTAEPFYRGPGGAASD